MPIVASVFMFVACSHPDIVPATDTNPAPSLIPTPSVTAITSSTPQTNSTPAPNPSTPSQIKPSPSPQDTARFEIEVVAGSGQNGYRDGKASEALFAEFTGLCADPTDQGLFILERTRIRKWLPQGQVITVAGSDESGFRDGAAEEALFQNLIACDVANDGTLYLADDTRVRLLKPTGEVLTLAGNNERKLLDGNLTEARFIRITDLKIAETGGVYLIDRFHIRQLKEGLIKTLNKEQQETNEMLDPPCNNALNVTYLHKTEPN